MTWGLVAVVTHHAKPSYALDGNPHVWLILNGLQRILKAARAAVARQAGVPAQPVLDRDGGLGTFAVPVSTTIVGGLARSALSSGKGSKRTTPTTFSSLPFCLTRLK